MALPSKLKDLEVQVNEKMASVNVIKANKRAMTLLKEYLISDDPQRIHCDKILCSPQNRGGAPPNIAYVHTSIATNVKVDGYSPQRPQPGLLRRLTDRPRIDAVVKHNEVFSGSSSGYPPIVKNMVGFECAAGNHLTLAIKLFAHKQKLLGTGEVFESDSDEALKLVCQEGHLYFILREDTPDEDLRFLSDWRNADQNQNQGNSEMQLMVTVNEITNK
jgi:hypothetical protein